MCSSGLPPKRMDYNSRITFCLTTDPKDTYIGGCFSPSFSALLLSTRGVLSSVSSKTRAEMELRRKGETNLSSTCRNPISGMLSFCS